MDRLRVALLVETSRGYGRGILHGVWQYIQEHETWSILYRPCGFGQVAPSWISSWDGDGIIAFIDTAKTARLLKQSGVPTVDLLGEVVPKPQVPFVAPDNQLVAGMAVQYFLDRGYQSFAACGFRTGLRPMLDQRCLNFQQQIRETGAECPVFMPRGGGKEGPSWEREQEQIAHWLQSLPKPLALFTCNDTRGREVLNACQSHNIPVPEEVAVLGVGNDDILCQLSDERLSSIDVDPQRVGYQAAALLDTLMHKKHVSDLTMIPPRRVVSRHSTDSLAVTDPELATAIQYIRRYACQQIQVEDVVKQVNLERRVLERRFRNLLGRSPKAEIIRLQLVRARELLAETSLSNTEIAYRCGFNSAAYFMDLFRRKVGQTPGDFRQASQSPEQTI